MKLFQSIFGAGESRGRYPEWLVEAAIERVVDGTDPRFRFLRGYRKRLREPVLRAIDHVVSLVDGIPPPLPAGHPDHASEPRLSVLFASPAEMLDVFSRDAELVDFLSGPEAVGAAKVTALLLAQAVERKILGMDLVGDRVRSDVAQVTVSFSGHRLLDPRGSESETRRQLKRRGFDHLISLALARIAEARIERAELARQRDLLRRKLTTLQRGGWSFDLPEDGHRDPGAMEKELESITAQLEALGADDRLLMAHLEMVCALLGEPERQLWGQEAVFVLDAMNIQRDVEYPSARRVAFQELHNVRGNRAVMLPLLIAPDQLPPREDLITAAQRYSY